MKRNQTAPKIVKSLSLPSKNYKYQNGRLLIVAGSRKYHGSLLYAVKTASRIVGMVYVLTSADNRRLITTLKSRTAEFIAVDKIPKSNFYDCALVGPGMEVNRKTVDVVRQILISKQKTVLDAAALRVLDKKLLKLLHPNCVLTPHPGEFRDVFKLPATDINAAKIAKKHRCVILLKLPKAVIVGPDGKITKNPTGNQGLAKGGSGDVLAGLIASLFCKNSARTSAAAAAYITGQAADDLHKTVRIFYNAEDLAHQIPLTLGKLFRNKQG